MGQKILTWAIVVLVLAVVMVAAVMGFSGKDDRGLVARDVRTERRTDPLAAELERCRTLGLEAADDPDCEAAWAENRKRFFSADRLSREDLQPKRQDRIEPTVLPDAPPSISGEEAR